MITGFTEASHMFRDIWCLYKKYAARELDEVGLEGFRDQVREIYERYKTPFVKEILLAVVGEIERMTKFYDKRRKGE